MPFYTISPKDNTQLCITPKASSVAAGSDAILQTSSQISSSLVKTWFIDSLTATDTQILNANNQAYGLSLPKTTSKNCELSLAGPANPNALIQLVSTGDGYYWIKTKSWNYYLSYNSATSGASVFWDVSPTDVNKKKWKLNYTTISGPTNYTYMDAVCGTSTLHIIRTAGGNLKLKNIQRKTPSQEGMIGINAGFFRWKNPDGTISNSVAVFNIAKCAGSYVGPDPSPNGGEYNGNGCGAGAIYRSSSGSYGYREVRDALTDPILKVLTGAKSWAQGGAGMYLGYSGWLSKAGVNWDNNLETSGASGRTALVVDTVKDNAYLIVSSDPIKYIPFRTAIMQYLEIVDGSTASTRFLGLFLDGGGSSQIRAYNPANKLVSLGGPRELCEVITI